MICADSQPLPELVLEPGPVAIIEPVPEPESLPIEPVPLSEPVTESEKVVPEPTKKPKKKKCSKKRRCGCGRHSEFDIESMIYKRIFGGHF